MGRCRGAVWLRRRSRLRRKKTGGKSDDINIGRGDGRMMMMITGNGGNTGIVDGMRGGHGRKVQRGNGIHIVANEIEMIHGGMGIEKTGTGGTEIEIANEIVITIEITRGTGMLDEEIATPSPGTTVQRATTRPDDNTEKKKEEIEITMIDNGTRPISTNTPLQSP
jgi:hypothetical protein